MQPIQYFHFLLYFHHINSLSYSEQERILHENILHCDCGCFNAILKLFGVLAGFHFYYSQILLFVLQLLLFSSALL